MKTKKILTVVSLAVVSLTATAQYPTIPDTVKQRGAQEEAQWDAMNGAAWQKAMPDVVRGMFEGKPFVPQCS